MTDITSTEATILRVSSSTDFFKLEKSIIFAYEKNPSAPIKVSVIGAGALNQAVKGIAAVNGYFSQRGLIATLYPQFESTTIKTSGGVDRPTSSILLKIILLKI